MVLDFDTILLWMVVGLVAGFVASHLALGHGLGLVGDLIAGIVGALVGGFLFPGQRRGERTRLLELSGSSRQGRQDAAPGVQAPVTVLKVEERK
ncbi:MAG: GlsB/YeaQ/YmgE family stress response membrane protein [Chloroflexi bacterium]|nr:MAG: GlsB/YeaQ/YmgE family stress response membrane protein [Chloroflexota bacterium]